MPNLNELQNYLSRIQANSYWIERVLEKGIDEEYARILINKLANIGYLVNQAISDLTLEKNEK